MGFINVPIKKKLGILIDDHLIGSWWIMAQRFTGKYGDVFCPWENLPGKPWEIGAPQHFLENQTPQQLHYGLW